MLFNSLVFVQFFIAFLFCYWLCRNNLRARNILVVLSSYFFYGWWDWRFLSLLLFSTFMDYWVGRGLEHIADPKRRKLLLLVSMCGNLGILGFFKYYGFFAQSLQAVLQTFDVHVSLRTLNIILPMGISFYTFQTMSYVIDVYRREIKATRSLIDFAAFVTFFPQLVAGPIERARHLLPQFEGPVTITYPMVREGLWLCLWGMFKKVVLADNLAPLVEMVYDNPNLSAPIVILGTVAFGLQIYCDFSGYSDIARGSARILGFDIMINFNVPYASTDIREFWRRWHISLSTWLRDYLYISLGGNRRGPVRTYVNLWLTMLLGGLWHGAAWNFVLWGFWHGAGLALHRLVTRNAKPTPHSFSLKSVLGWLATMMFVLYGWLLFRADSMHQITEMTRALTRFSTPIWIGSYLLNLAAFASPIIAMDIWQTVTKDPLAPLKLPWWGRALLQGSLGLAILMFWHKQQASFIYFQF